MRTIIFLFAVLLLNQTQAQHVEVNLFEKASHKKYVEYQVKGFIKTNKLAGFTFILANKGRVVYSKALGQYKIGVPLTLNNPLPIEDSTRLFTASAILKLVQEGKVSPEDTIFGPKSIFENESHLE